MRISFRSRFSGNLHPGNSLQKKLHTGNDWNSLQPYQPGNDAKNIFWKKSSLQINEKILEENFHIHIMVAIIKNFGDDFYLDGYPSKSDWKNKSEKIISHHAHKEQHQYEGFFFSSLENFCQNLIQKKIQKKLIFIFCNELLEEKNKNLEKIAKMNEIIWIVGYHHFEKNPTENILMEGKILPKKGKQKYLQALEKAEKNHKKILSSMNISYIQTLTTENIEATLHHFFKYQYAHK